MAKSQIKTLTVAKGAKKSLREGGLSGWQPNCARKADARQSYRSMYNLDKEGRGKTCAWMKSGIVPPKKSASGRAHTMAHRPQKPKKVA